MVGTREVKNIISSRVHRGLFKCCELQKMKKTFTVNGHATKAFKLSWLLATLRSGNNYINSEMYVIESDPSHCLAETLLFTFLL